MEHDMSHEVRRVFEAAAFVAELGIRMDSFGEGWCEASLELADRHLQQDGVVHAGVHATLADHTSGAAAATLLREHQQVLSVEFKLNLLRAARGERLRCRARVLKPGRRFSVVEAEVFCAAGGEERLVSKMSSTMAVVEGKRTGTPEA